MKRLFCLKAKNGLNMKRLFCLKAKDSLIKKDECYTHIHTDGVTK